MSHHVVEIVHTSAHPVTRLFDELAQHEKLRRVFGVPVRRIEAGEDRADGVGSVRRIGIGRLGIDETVTELERDKTIEYRITRGGFPIRNHVGRLAFDTDTRGSRVTWRIEFDAPPVVGTLVSRLLDRVLRRGLVRLEP